MDDLKDFPHHPVLDEISEILVARTGRDARPFFRTLAVYYLGTVASCMRAKIVSPAFKEVSLNNYVVALAPSGFGKGLATGYMEKEIMCDFRMSFRDFVLPWNADKHLTQLASRFAALSGRTEAHELEKLEKDFAQCGEYPFVFDGGSESAIKQVRHMLLMADCGALNLKVDEIGTNLEKSSTAEAMAVYLELYDSGDLGNKVKMNTTDNKRSKELEGSTPANMLLFGTQDRLLDGGPLEKKWTSLLETGYARRGLFAWADESSMVSAADADEDAIFERLTNPANSAAAEKWKQHFASLADPSRLNWTIESSEAVDKLVLRYQIDCNKRAKALGEFGGVRRMDLENRHSRALKVAGTLAFVDESLVLTEDHVMAAIKVVEESGDAFNKMMEREPVYAKLARYIASLGRETTHAELLEKLPFFKAAPKSDRNDLVSLATQWGYEQHVVIKKRFHDGIELLSGEALKKTDLNEIHLSFSTDYAYHYQHVHTEFADIANLVAAPNHHWAAHGFVDQHRCDEKVIPGFDLLVFDIDGGLPLQTCHELLGDYAFMTYTTKRHTEEENRYRLILPMNYQLKLDPNDYREFYRNVMSWLPFEVDDSTTDRCRKWAANVDALVTTNLEGRLFDVLPFIPRTKRNEARQAEYKALESLDNLERWFAQRIAEGSRNNGMIKFALALVDSGMDYNEVEQKVLAFNSKLSNGLDPAELQRTVLVTAAKRLQAQP
jgi:hypothetical protein